MPPIDANSNPDPPLPVGPFPIAKPVYPQPVREEEDDDDFEYVEEPRPRRSRRPQKLAKWVRLLLTLILNMKTRN